LARFSIETQCSTHSTVVKESNVFNKEIYRAPVVTNAGANSCALLYSQTNSSQVK